MTSTCHPFGFKYILALWCSYTWSRPFISLFFGLIVESIIWQGWIAWDNPEKVTKPISLYLASCLKNDFLWKVLCFCYWTTWFWRAAGCRPFAIFFQLLVIACVVYIFELFILSMDLKLNGLCGKHCCWCRNIRAVLKSKLNRQGVVYLFFLTILIVQYHIPIQQFEH